MIAPHTCRVAGWVLIGIAVGCLLLPFGVLKPWR